MLNENRLFRNLVGLFSACKSEGIASMSQGIISSSKKKSTIAVGKF